MFLLLEMAGQQ